MAAICPICHGPLSVGVHPSALCERERERLLDHIRQDQLDKNILQALNRHHQASVALQKAQTAVLVAQRNCVDQNIEKQEAYAVMVRAIKDGGYERVEYRGESLPLNANVRPQ